MMSLFSETDNAVGAEVQKQKRMLSGIGAAAYSVAAALLLVICVYCMRTDAQQAILCLLIPFLYMGAGYLISALLVQGRAVFALACAAAGVLGGYVLVLDPVRAVLCLGAFVSPVCVYFSTKKKRLTFSGNICLSACGIAFSLVCVLCVLSYKKYGEFGIDAFVRAYGSLCEIILREPKATLEYLRANGTEELGEMTEYYAALVKTLEELLSVMLYSVPSLFINICAIGGFITVLAAKKHRAMLGLSDTVGAWGISVIGSVLFVILSVLSIFADPLTPIGLAVVTVSAPLELGLAVSGVLFFVEWTKKNGKGPFYYIALAALFVLIPSLCIMTLAYIGAYRTVFLYRMKKIDSSGKDKGPDR